MLRVSHLSLPLLKRTGRFPGIAMFFAHFVSEIKLLDKNRDQTGGKQERKKKKDESCHRVVLPPWEAT